MRDTDNWLLTSKQRGGSLTLVRGLLIATGVGAALVVARRQVWGFARRGGVLCYMRSSHAPQRHSNGLPAFECRDCGKTSPDLEGMGFDHGYVGGRR